MEIPYAAFPEDMIDTVTTDVDEMAVGTVITNSKWGNIEIRYFLEDSNMNFSIWKLKKQKHWKENWEILISC